MTNEELYMRNRSAVKKYLQWREQMNREAEDEEPETINEYRLEMNSLTCK